MSTNFESAFETQIKGIINEITQNYETEDVFYVKDACRLPSRNDIIGIIKELRKVMFPGYFGGDYFGDCAPEYHVGNTLIQIHEKLTGLIYLAFRWKNTEECDEKNMSLSKNACETFLSSLGHIQKLLIKDVQAAYDGDPAAKSKEEIIFCYPGLFAIFVYRIAHELYKLDIPFIPRIMSEYAHSRTGIDINPGATIGEYFFIDHGTGVVIGETTIIGNNVKIYQGVTIGALSTRSGQLLSGVKRHPTIEDNVTIYSSASILGGETIIGKNSIIGGNAFIVKSVPPCTRVSVKNPELTFTEKTDDSCCKKEKLWDWSI